MSAITQRPVKQRIQQGFTLIELMIVVAIIGILAAIAIPSYQDYIARSQATEAVVLLGALRSPIAEYWAANGDEPGYEHLNSYGEVSTGGKYLLNISDGTGGAGSGKYQATFNAAGKVNARLANRTIVMTFETAMGTFSWSCVSIEDTIQPKVCDR